MPGGKRGIRRRQRRPRLVGLTLGIALLGGLSLIERPLSPEPQEPASPAVAPTLSAATSLQREAAVYGAAADATTAGVAALPTAPDAMLTETAASAPEPPPLSEASQTVEARPGDTPLSLLTRIGVAREDAQAAVRQLSTVWNPRGLRAGQKAAVSVQSDRLLSVRLVLAPGRDVVVARDDSGGFIAEDQDRPTSEVTALGAGTIHTSLSEAASRAGVPAGVLGEMIRAFSYDVDFQREIRPDDSFTVLYQRVDDEFGRPTGSGHMLYAEMILSGVRLRLYRYAVPGSEVGYYNAIGENIRKPLLRTPVDAVRITSGFGMRFHPILGYSRMHRGVDFAAPIGTAIYAAGDGVVTEAGPSAGYGNYVEIAHNQQYATAYGHLSAFARGLHVGEQVRQGEVIGYVGMSGMATGPHLHYEVHYQGVQIDPLSVKMPAMTRLAGNELTEFQRSRDAIERQLFERRQDLMARVNAVRGHGEAQLVH
jgi:murein DD-endopeptidase MepM/ murein hydrolase activator NlpD